MKRDHIKQGKISRSPHPLETWTSALINPRLLPPSSPGNHVVGVVSPEYSSFFDVITLLELNSQKNQETRIIAYDEFGAPYIIRLIPKHVPDQTYVKDPLRIGRVSESIPLPQEISDFNEITDFLKSLPSNIKKKIKKSIKETGSARFHNLTISSHDALRNYNGSLVLMSDPSGKRWIVYYNPRTKHAIQYDLDTGVSKKYENGYNSFNFVFRNLKTSQKNMYNRTGKMLYRNRAFENIDDISNIGDIPFFFIVDSADGPEIEDIVPSSKLNTLIEVEVDS